jgi:hypothetical protein
MATSGDDNNSVRATKRTGNLDNPNLIRFRAALLDAHRRLDGLKARTGQANPVVIAAAICLDHAEAEFEKKNYYVAWDCLHQFDDEMLAGLTPAELDAYWCTLSAEAQEKLKGGWRAVAADCLIKKVVVGNPVPIEVARALQRHLAATAQNKQHKIEVYERTTLPTLTLVLGIVVFGALAFSYYVLNVGPASGTLAHWGQLLVPGILAGGVGGILSMTFSLGRVDASRKIPEMRLGALMTYMRPLLGAAVAIPVSVIVDQKYVEIKGFTDEGAILAFCFLAGFSERWFLGLMDKLETDKSAPPTK